MKTEPKIKFSQLVLFLYLTMLFPFMLISGDLLSKVGIWCYVIWIVLELIQIPVLFLVSKRTLSLQKGFFDFIIRGVTLIFLLMTALKFTVMFCNFFSDMVNAESAYWFISGAILLVCAYAAFRGIRGLSSSAVIIGAVTVLMLVLLVIGIVPEIDPGHVFKTLGNDSDPLEFLIMLVSLNSVFPLILIFSPETGKPKTTAVVWVPIALIISQALVIFLTVARLGKFAFTQPYPIMSLFRSPTLNILESVSGVWIMTLTLLCLAAVSICISGSAVLIGNPRKKTAVGILAAVVFAMTFLQNSKLIDVNGKICIYIMSALSIISTVLCIVRSKRKKLE